MRLVCCVGLDPDLVARIDQAGGHRGRSKLIRQAVLKHLDDLERAELAIVTSNA